MSSRVVIESGYHQNFIQWNGAAESEAIDVNPGRSYSFYVDKDFQGTVLTVQSWIEYQGLPPDGSFAKNQGRWITRKVYGSSLQVPILPNTIEYVQAEIFAGIGRIRLVSDVAEDGTGLVLINT